MCVYDVGTRGNEGGKRESGEGEKRGFVCVYDGGGRGEKRGERGGRGRGKWKRVRVNTPIPNPHPRCAPPLTHTSPTCGSLEEAAGSGRPR